MPLYNVTASSLSLGTAEIGERLMKKQVIAICEYLCHTYKGVPDARKRFVDVDDSAVPECPINPNEKTTLRIREAS